MRQLTVLVAEIATSAGQIHVSCPAVGVEPVPGQFYLVRAEGLEAGFLRHPIFPYVMPGVGLGFSIPNDHPLANLKPGMTLDLLGPCGRGFSLGSRMAQVVLVCQTPARLQCLLDQVLGRGGSVTLLLPLEAALPEVPLAVEIQRGDVSPELAAWADVFVLDLPDPRPLAHAIRALGPTRPVEFVQALWTPEMPCGTGACGACWVDLGRSARALACVDGPVFFL